MGDNDFVDSVRFAFRVMLGQSIWPPTHAMAFPSILCDGALPIILPPWLIESPTTTILMA